MSVLERSELEASPLADLHAIADQLGLDGFRRLRKADLIDAILDDASQRGGSRDASQRDAPQRGGSQRDAPQRGGAPRGGAHDADSDNVQARDGGDRSQEEHQDGEPTGAAAATSRRRRPAGRTARARARRLASDDHGPDEPGPGEADERANGEEDDQADADPTAIAEGVVEVLGNGSAFLRVAPPDASDADLYISAAQVRRCELVSGDRVTGPVRPARRSERYPSLVRIDTINGSAADSVAERVPYEELPVEFPNARLAFDSPDPTLTAIEWLTPLGRGSRVVICGARLSGKTTTLHNMLDVLAARPDLQLSLVLVGVRPEEIVLWQQGAVAPLAALTFAASPDAQDQAVERAIDLAKRSAARGADAVLLVDSLDGLHPHAARKALAAARNLRDGGSLTVIATASRPFGGETTVIALDATLTSTGRQPILDLLASGTLRPELLVGEDGSRAITSARAAALESSGG
jgi:transcription termination factor Rho